MFRKIKNIETSFQHVRLFTIIIVVAAFAAIGFMAWQNRLSAASFQQRVYVLSGNMAWAAEAATKKNWLPLAAKGSVRAFHELFFSLDPDDKVNRRNLSRSLELADGSARRIYDSLNVGGYYANVVAGNIRQRIEIDSVQVIPDAEPYHFRCFARLVITRSTSQVSQELVTEGDLYEAQRSENNLLGLLIRHWTILQQKTINVTAR